MHCLSTRPVVNFWPLSLYSEYSGLRYSGLRYPGLRWLLCISTDLLPLCLDSAVDVHEASDVAMTVTTGLVSTVPFMN